MSMVPTLKAACSCWLETNIPQLVTAQSHVLGHALTVTQVQRCPGLSRAVLGWHMLPQILFLILSTGYFTNSRPLTSLCPFKKEVGHLAALSASCRVASAEAKPTLSHENECAHLSMCLCWWGDMVIWVSCIYRWDISCGIYDNVNCVSGPWVSVEWKSMVRVWVCSTCLGTCVYLGIFVHPCLCVGWGRPMGGCECRLLWYMYIGECVPTCVTRV